MWNKGPPEFEDLFLEPPMKPWMCSMCISGYVRKSVVYIQITFKLCPAHSDMKIRLLSVYIGYSRTMPTIKLQWTPLQFAFVVSTSQPLPYAEQYGTWMGAAYCRFTVLGQHKNKIQYNNRWNIPNEPRSESIRWGYLLPIAVFGFSYIHCSDHVCDHDE